MEKTYNKLSLLFFVVFAMAGASCEPSQGDLPCINVHKNYPEKQTPITEFADISYVHLDAQDRDYLFSGTINDVTESTIVVFDRSSGSVLFFTRDGRPKSRFNRSGRGPGEYAPISMLRAIYDEDSDEVFLFVSEFGFATGSSILVYSSTGEYKRTLSLPKGIMPFYPIEFDAQSLFFYDDRKRLDKSRKLPNREDLRYAHPYNSDYYRVSKADGSVLESVDFADDDIFWMSRSSAGSRTTASMSRVGKAASGLYICHAEVDTVFFYDGALRPVICKTPLVSDLDSKTILSNFVDAGRYQFVQTSIPYDFLQVPREKWPKYEAYYTHDTRSGEIFRQKISLPEYKDKVLHVSSYHTHYIGKEALTIFSLNMIELKEAYDAGRLSGKLKALVGRLDEDVDNIYLFARFK